MDQPVWGLVFITIIFTLLFTIMDVNNTTAIKQDTFESVRAANQNALIAIQKDYNEMKKIQDAQMFEEWLISFCNNSNVAFKDIELNFVQIETDPSTFLVSIENDAGHYAIVPKEAMVQYYSGSTIVSVEGSTSHPGTGGGTSGHIEIDEPEVEKITVSNPTISGSLTYNGKIQYPDSIIKYDKEHITVSGDMSGKDAGTYSITFTLNNPREYQWINGNTEPKTLSWSIQKATPTLSVGSISSFTSNTTKKATITTNSDGTLSVKSDNTNYFNASISEKTLSVTSKNISTTQRSATITVSIAETSNYLSTTKDVSVTSKKSSCVTGDTLITLADYSTKRIDELTYEDEILTWDFFEGKLIKAKPMIIFHHKDYQGYINLIFDDGANLKLVNSHELYSASRNNWVEINEKNYQEYLNDEFIKINEKGKHQVKLISAELIDELVTSYSVEVPKHVNVVANGMLTFTPQPKEGVYKFFTIGENMKYDNELMNNDIQKYGIFTYEELSPYGLTQEFYEVSGAKYWKVFIGRGILTFDEIVEIINEYVNPQTLNEDIKR